MLPHANVAIDLGTEFTKACYAIRSNEEYRTILEVCWTVENSSLLPTAVTKTATHSTFGGQALLEGEKMGYQRTFIAFKLALLDDQSQVFAIGDTNFDNPEEVNKLAVDFFRYLLEDVERLVQPELLGVHHVRWNQANIHLVLSMPATGNDGSRARYFNALEGIITKAGFCCPGHRIVGGMTEPQAAAKYALGRKIKGENRWYKNNETCILVDVGGGTADVCAFRIRDVASQDVVPIGIRPLRGVNIGGIMINRYLDTLLTSYLTGHRALLCDAFGPADTARILAWGKSANRIKIDLGRMLPAPQSPTSLVDSDYAKLKAPVPIFVDSDGSSEENGLLCYRGSLQELRTRLNHLASFMDRQILGDGLAGSGGIWGLTGDAIDDVYVSGRGSEPLSTGEQLKAAMGSETFEPKVDQAPAMVDHIILAGGFGSQDYVCATIKAAARRDCQIPANKQTGSPKYVNLAKECIRQIENPQLSVAIGLAEAYRAQVQAQEEETDGKKPSWISRAWLRISAFGSS